MRLPSSLIYFDILSLAREINSYLLSGVVRRREGGDGDFPGSCLFEYGIPGFAGSENRYGGSSGDGDSPRRIVFPLTLAPPIGSLAGNTVKSILLAFHEYLPLEKWVRWPRCSPGWTEAFSPGRSSRSSRSSTADSRPICWRTCSGLFRRFVASGANFMVSVSNEAFYGDSAAPYQILAMLCRSGPWRTGFRSSGAPQPGSRVSSRPHGRILDTVRDANGRELFATGVLTRDVQLSDAKTFYTRYGDLFAGGVGTLGGLAALYAILPRKRVPDEPST